MKDLNIDDFLQYQSNIKGLEQQQNFLTNQKVDINLFDKNSEYMQGLYAFICLNHV